MNPGNGIETSKSFTANICGGSFLFMNPGNGIETCNFDKYPWRLSLCFLFMNPGNGIETRK